MPLILLHPESPTGSLLEYRPRHLKVKGRRRARLSDLPAQRVAVDYREERQRRIRAFNPFPGAFTSVGADSVKLRKASVLVAEASGDGVPGQVLAASGDGIDICTGEGVLRVLQLQKAGGKVLAAADFLRGFDMQPGLVLGNAATQAIQPD